jgi:predicted Zn finger-like uncharacterized protein
VNLRIVFFLSLFAKNNVIINCHNCNASLQIDEKKASAERFAIRCPKCQTAIPVQIEKSGADSNTTLNNSLVLNRSWDSAPAAPFQKNAPSVDENSVNNAELLRVLTAALGQATSGGRTANFNAPYTQPQKRVLLCLNAERTNSLASLLHDADYEVFIAENPAQATEKIRDEEADIVIFTPDFAAKFSGASVLQQMLLSLTAIERRRIFVVALEESSQTFNTHEAFLRNLNLIVNVNDSHHLPSILYRALRDYNELYRYFNHAATN